MVPPRIRTESVGRGAKTGGGSSGKTGIRSLIRTRCVFAWNVSAALRLDVMAARVRRRQGVGWRTYFVIAEREPARAFILVERKLAYVWTADFSSGSCGNESADRLPIPVQSNPRSTIFRVFLGIRLEKAWMRCILNIILWRGSSVGRATD